MSDFSYLGPRLQETITMIQNAAMAFERLADEKLAQHRLGSAAPPKFVRLIDACDQPMLVNPAAVTFIGAQARTGACDLWVAGQGEPYRVLGTPEDVAARLGFDVTP